MRLGSPGCEHEVVEAEVVVDDPLRHILGLAV